MTAVKTNLKPIRKEKGHYTINEFSIVNFRGKKWSIRVDFGPTLFIAETLADAVCWVECFYQGKNK